MKIIFFILTVILFACSKTTNNIIKPSIETKQNEILRIKTNTPNWLDDHTFQFYYNERFNSTQDINLYFNKAKNLLIETLLNDIYEISLQDKKQYTEQLIANSIIKPIANEQIAHKIENQRIFILIRQKGNNLKQKLYLKPNVLEQTYPELISKRRKTN